ncbi:glycosyltransferase family 4 protein [Luteimonas terricola]|uniref:Glycosyl transferase n=1 Tax=Luteimonas terricola TaxID=645597 RepID=A0ABQ2EFP8_9GAMM|nr:glycosyltransferase family 1 protein [Luteimonas terricola]GGK09815.1 glycosyl transferase [Luteimonas terricola]
MRYTIVTETYPPEVNGVALTVRELERGLRARGHEVEVVRPRQHRRDRPADGELLTAGALLPFYSGLRFGLPSVARLRRHWRRQRPDAIYIATEGPLGWSAMRAAKALGIPVASGFHTRFDHYMRDYAAQWMQPVALAWMRRFHNRSAATLVPTLELRTELNGLGFDNVVHLPRAVDTRRFDPGHRDEALRARWGLKPDGLAVTYVGRMAAEKNLDLAIRAFRALQELRPDARFIWVGEGPELGGIREANPDFIYCGMQRGEALAHHFASADLFLFPSLSETFGNVTLEAMASGVATVAYRYGAAAEHLMHGVHGAAIALHDEEAFIDAACRLSLEDASRRDMGGNARRAVQPLRPAQVAADFDAVLQGIALRRSHADVHAALA